MKTERGCGHEGGDVSQTEVLGQGVEVVGAKGKAGFRYLGGAAQRTGMDRKGEGAVMTKKNVTISAILLNIGMICDLCRLCGDEELSGRLNEVFL